MDTQELQVALNVVRENRELDPLRPIPVTGVFDRATSDALRAFQHEYNLFIKKKFLKETGEFDHSTEMALYWMVEVVHETAIA
jgi:peptidoglycan hydrolase-like protein with peptidoglycan-binding domain